MPTFVGYVVGKGADIQPDRSTYASFFSEHLITYPNLIRYWRKTKFSSADHYSHSRQRQKKQGWRALGQWLKFVLALSVNLHLMHVIITRFNLMFSKLWALEVKQYINKEISLSPKGAFCHWSIHKGRTLFFLFPFCHEFNNCTMLHNVQWMSSSIYCKFISYNSAGLSAD